MADGAILYNRRMLVQKWPLILGMAVKTDIIEVCFFKIFIFRAMVFMTATAAHLLFFQRMMGREQVLCSFILVAGETDVRIAKMHHFRGSNLMGFMALVAPNTVDDMSVSTPVHHRIAAVTLQADFRTLNSTETRKTNDIAGAPLCLDMAASRTMTRLATTLCPAALG